MVAVIAMLATGVDAWLDEVHLAHGVRDADGHRSASAAAALLLEIVGARCAGLQ